MTNYFWTKLTTLLILVVLISTALSENSTHPKDVLIQDVQGYYTYLPALFIQNDIELKNTNVYQKDGTSYIWYMIDGDKQYLKYPPGWAILNSPFFLTAHFYALITNYPPNGYSEPYIFSIILGSLFYSMLGLLFITKLLKLYFDDRTVALTIFTIFLSTNLFFYQTYDLSYSHTYSFAMVSVLLYSTAQWYKTYKWKYAILMGVSGGLAMAVRNIDVIFLLLIPLFGLQSFSDVKARFQLFWKYKLMVLVTLSLFVLMLAPQFAYNLLMFGKIYYHAYEGERFFFNQPHLYDSLFSFRNGWLIYTPIMALSIIGLVLIPKRVSEFKVGMLVLPIYFFVIASWWCWWFVGFGNRAYINLYPLLSLPLAATFAYIVSKRWTARLLLLIVLGFFSWLNRFQSYQYKKGVIHWDAMTKEYYSYVWGAEHPSTYQRLYEANPIVDSVRAGVNASFIHIPDTLQNVEFDLDNKTEFSEEYFGEFSIPLSSVGNGNYISVTTTSSDEDIPYTVFNGPNDFNMSRQDYLDYKDGWLTTGIMFDISSFSPTDTLTGYLYNPGKKTIQLKSVNYQVLLIRDSIIID